MTYTQVQFVDDKPEKRRNLKLAHLTSVSSVRQVGLLNLAPVVKTRRTKNDLGYQVPSRLHRPPGEPGEAPPTLSGHEAIHPLGEISLPVPHAASSLND